MIFKNVFYDVTPGKSFIIPYNTQSLCGGAIVEPQGVIIGELWEGASPQSTENTPIDKIIKILDIFHLD